MRQRRSFVVLVLAGFLAGCGVEGGEESDGTGEAARVTGEPTELTYAPALDVSLDQMTRAPSGLYTRELAPGDGPAAGSGSQVTVHYTGWLANGEQFDSSRDAGQPFTFTLGAGEVIGGWDEGVEGMQVGVRRQLVIPPALGYGERGAGGVIPPNATLVFDVELLEVR